MNRVMIGECHLMLFRSRVDLQEIRMGNEITTKAWYVTLRNNPNGSDGADVVHAATRGKAITVSQLYFEDGDFLGLRAVRLPGMDGKKVTDENLYTYGHLMVACRVCEGYAHGQDGGDPYFDKKGRAYCWEHRPT